MRVGLIDGEYVINPTYSERSQSRLDLIVGGGNEAIVMVEAGANEVSEDEMLTALKTGHEAIREIVGTIDEMAAAEGKAKLEVAEQEIGKEVYRDVAERVMDPLGEAMRIRGKLENYERVDQVQADLVASIPEAEIERRVDAKRIFKQLKEKVLRDEVLERGQRLDGRKFDEIRDIWSEVGILPRVHGSAVFTRGETQALVTATLGTRDDQQKVERVDGETYKRFLLHYNFPPFSVGEVKFLRGPGRREIGHGHLAERSLLPMIPGEDDFPYTVRVVSDILESNGSSSMATVCGGTLALMDAGVPLKAPVAGVAMGLIIDAANPDRYAVLSDIAGAEDHYGDMDFKVAGTINGITALQMDIKVSGITSEILQTALAQARSGRLHILEKMRATIASPRDSISTYAPRIVDNPDSGGQDTRRHRTRRQDHPQHRRAHRCQDRRRGRWTRERSILGRGGRAKSDRDHRRVDGQPGAQQDLPRKGPAHYRLRCVRRDPARHRWVAPRVGDRPLPGR